MVQSNLFKCQMYYNISYGSETVSSLIVNYLHFKTGWFVWTDCFILKCYWNEYNRCLAHTVKAFKDLFCPLGPTCLPNWNKFTINMTECFRFKIQLNQVKWLMDLLFYSSWIFPLMLALADKDYIFPWHKPNQYSHWQTISIVNIFLLPDID